MIGPPLGRQLNLTSGRFEALRISSDKIALLMLVENAAGLLPVAYLIFPNRQHAFLLMIKKTMLAQTGAAGRTVEFIAVANVIPALIALYGSIDELKHPDASRCGWAQGGTLSD